jgi:CobQ-like glutamine amidotransferase family enzyme
VTTLTILELFPEHLAVNGDMGNVIVLRERLRRAGFDVQHVAHNPGDALPETADLVTIGTGPVSALRVLEPSIASIAGRLRDWRDAGVPMLAVTAGLQLFGNTIALPGGDSITGAGIFDIETDATADRVVTNCFVVDTPDAGRLIGIENHGSVTHAGPSAVPFGTAVTGRGNGSDRAEGVRASNAIGTHLQGPALAMNPALADRLIEIAVSRRDLNYVTTGEHDTLDALALECRRILARSAGVSVTGSVG